MFRRLFTCLVVCLLVWSSVYLLGRLFTVCLLVCLFWFVQRIERFAELIFTGQLNWAAVVTSVLCIALLLAIDVVNSILRKKVKKIPIHIPAQLIVVSHESCDGESDVPAYYQ